jgi:hypothetical protein
MFAYLVMVFFAGSRLTRLQAVIASALYVWASVLTTYATVGAMWRALYFRDAVMALRPEVQMFMNGAMVMTISVRKSKTREMDINKLAHPNHAI